MVLGMSLATYTIVHVIISLIGIATGFIVLFGLLKGRLLGSWNTTFLITTVLTSVTGFFFPFTKVTPGIILGVLSLIVLAHRHLRALRLPSQRTMAPHLRHHRPHRALLQRLRPDRANLREGTRNPRTGSHPNRSALQNRPAPPVGVLHRGHYRCGEKVSQRRANLTISHHPERRRTQKLATLYEPSS